MNKAQLLSPIRLFLTSLPQWFTRIPYTLSLFLARFRLRAYKGKIWPRNSYMTQNLTLLLSDIDLTLFFSHRPKGSKRRWLIRKIRRLRKINPLIGEFNVYDQNSIESFIKFANPYEIQRDPTLLEAIGYKSTPPHPLQVTSFLSQLFLFDRHQLAKAAKLRSSKWNRHFSVVDPQWQNQQINDTQQFIKLLMKYYPKQYFDHHELKLFFNQLINDELDQLDSRTLLKIYPVWWLSLYFIHGETENVPAMEQSDLTALEYHLNWEIWGLYSQYIIEDDLENFIQHIERLINLCTHFDFSQQKYAFEQLKHYTEELSHES